MSTAPVTIFAIWFAKSGHFEHGGTWEHPYGTATFTDRDAAERHLKRLNDDKWYRKFEPYIVEYNLKEN